MTGLRYFSEGDPGAGAEPRSEAPPDIGAASGTWSPAPIIRASVGLHAAALVGVTALPGAWPWFSAGVLANHACLGAIGMWPQSKGLGPNLVRLPLAATQRGEIALTFDDGPDPEVTPMVLDLLDRFGAKATFFFIGRNAAAYPSIVRDVVARGHAVENHSDSHPNWFACLPPGPLMREVGIAQARLADITGVSPRFFRPPMGLRSPLLDPILARFGLHHVSWTRRGIDTLMTDPDKVFRRLSRRIMPGDVLLLHDRRPIVGGAAAANPVAVTVLAKLLALLTRLQLHPVTLGRAVMAECG